MQISVPRFVEMGKKSASLFEAQRPIVLFSFFFLFRFTPFLPPLFSAPREKCDSWPATFRFLPPLNFQKAAQDRERAGQESKWLPPYRALRYLPMRHWLTFIRFRLREKLNDDCSARRLCTTTSRNFVPFVSLNVHCINGYKEIS